MAHVSATPWFSCLTSYTSFRIVLRGFIVTYTLKKVTWKPRWPVKNYTCLITRSCFYTRLWGLRRCLDDLSLPTVICSGLDLYQKGKYKLKILNERCALSHLRLMLNTNDFSFSFSKNKLNDFNSWRFSTWVEQNCCSFVGLIGRLRLTVMILDGYR